MKNEIMCKMVLLCALLPLGCIGYEVDGDYVSDRGIEDGGDLAYATSPLWAASSYTRWPGGVVPVCFQGFTTAQRNRIRAAAENSWERAAMVNFFGWGTCPTLNSETTNLLVFSIQADLNGAAGDSSICTNENVASCNIAGLGQAASGDYNRIRFISGDPATGAVIHELGHVLGFIHETDSSTMCTQRTSGGVSLENEGDSENSIMVAFGSCHDATTLSDWDVLGVRNEYGTHIPGNIVGVNGNCLNIQGGSTTIGANIIGWSCQGAPWNNIWKRNYTGSLLLQASTDSTYRCLNVKGGTVGTGFTDLISWSCSSEWTNEHFHFTGVEWRAMGGRCIQAENDTSGSRIALERCTGGPLQKWDFFEGDNRIRLHGTSMCVNVPNNNTANGTELILFPCSTGAPYANERFVFADSFIQYGSKVFNVRYGTMASGNRVILWDKSSTPNYNDQFSILGPLTALGQCVDTYDTSSHAFEGVKIGVRPCNGSNNQNWEYFW